MTKNHNNNKILNNKQGKSYFSKGVSDLHITAPSNQEQIIQMWGHTLNITNNSISCDDCELSKEIPDIIKGGDGFTLVVFKLYFLHTFKEEPCNEDQDTLLETDINPYDAYPEGFARPPDGYVDVPGNIYWS